MSGRLDPQLEDGWSELSLSGWAGLAAELRIEPNRCTVVLRGALIAGSIAALEAQIDQLACTSCRAVVIDVRELSLLDEIGTSVLTGLSHYVRARGGNLRVVGARDQVARELAGTPLALDPTA